MRIVGNTNNTNNTAASKAASASELAGGTSAGGAGIPLRSECDPKLRVQEAAEADQGADHADTGADCEHPEADREGVPRQQVEAPPES